MRSSASWSSSLPLMSLSPFAAALRCLVRSSCAAFSLACSLASAAVASPPLASFCLVTMSFLAVKTASEASSSTAEVFSVASLIASVVILSKLSERKSLAASQTTATFFSAIAMLSTTSASRDAILRSEVSFLKLTSFFVAASPRTRSWFSSSEAVFARSGERRLTSAALVLAKVLAWLIINSAFVAAASESAIALVLSSCGRISRPLRKGISASWHFVRDSSAFSIFSVAAASISAVTFLSFCFRRTATMVLSFFCEPIPFSLIRVSSSFMGPVDCRSFCSMSLSWLASSFCRGVTISSADVTSSSDISPFSAMLVTMVAFSVSTSTFSSFSLISVSCFLASTRPRKSFWKVLKGFSFVWASVSFCWSTEHSASAFFLASGA
mmetsp:Transcript_70862/g.200792  ORF Transcript_70862/g.200792 Transcript_70862/m.200792 type:complete len:383 (+) Transcript_70862:3928-5076(+)